MASKTASQAHLLIHLAVHLFQLAGERLQVHAGGLWVSKAGAWQV